MVDVSLNMYIFTEHLPKKVFLGQPEKTNSDIQVYHTTLT